MSVIFNCGFSSVAVKESFHKPGSMAKESDPVKRWDNYNDLLDESARAKLAVEKTLYMKKSRIVYDFFRKMNSRNRTEYLEYFSSTNCAKTFPTATCLQSAWRQPMIPRFIFSLLSDCLVIPNTHLPMAASAIALYQGLKFFFMPSYIMPSGVVNCPVFRAFCDNYFVVIVSMPRFSRENTIEEKRRMRNRRNKRKRLSRVEKQREAEEIIRQKERAAYSRVKELARVYYGKWKQLGEQKKSWTLDKTKVSFF